MTDEFSRQMALVTDAVCVATLYWMPKSGPESSKEERLFAALLHLAPEEPWFREAAKMYGDCITEAPHSQERPQQASPADPSG